MPYSSVDELPARVKKLPDSAQRQYLAVFNSAYKKCQDEGGSDCEASASKQATSVAFKELNTLIAEFITDGDLLVTDSTPLPLPTTKQDCPYGGCVGCQVYTSVLSPVWTKEFISLLPDHAFAAPGRHLPYKSYDGSIIKPLLRHSLSKASNDPILVKAAKEVGILPADEPTGILGIITKAVRGSAPTSPHGPVQCETPAIITTKAANGRMRVIMRVSNNYKDRHHEIITESAHKEFVSYLELTGNYPEFWIWHIKGTRWGQADWVGYDDSGFLMASGLVDPGYEPIAESMAQLNLGVSHGFYGVTLDNKNLIEAYRSFEFSPLPIMEAANLWTAYRLAKEAVMPLDVNKRKFLIEDLGIPETVIAGLEAENKGMADILKAAGIEYKDAGVAAAQGAPAQGTGSEGTTGNSGNPADTGAAGDVGGTGGQTPSVTTPTLADIKAVVEGVVAPLRAELVEVKNKQAQQETDLTSAVTRILGAPIPGTPANGTPPSTKEGNVVTPAAAQQATGEPQPDPDDWFYQSPLVAANWGK